MPVGWELPPPSSAKSGADLERERESMALAAQASCSRSRALRRVVAVLAQVPSARAQMADAVARVATDVTIHVEVLGPGSLVGIVRKPGPDREPRQPVD